MRAICQIKYFMYQLLCGLKYFQALGLMHRDLKPENVLVQQHPLTLSLHWATRTTLAHKDGPQLSIHPSTATASALKHRHHILVTIHVFTTLVISTPRRLVMMGR